MAHTTSPATTTGSINTLGGVMHTSTAAQLATNDIVFSGHGYGEAPAFVVSASRFTRRLTVVVLQHGNTRRTLNVASDQVFDWAPRTTESNVGLPDYDFARDNR